jgi:hypothetical protein
MAAVDAQFYWMSAKIPNDEFLLYAFGGEPADVDGAVAQVLRRARGCGELGLVVREGNPLTYPQRARAPIESDRVVRHELADDGWAGCLDAAAVADQHAVAAGPADAARPATARRSRLPRRRRRSRLWSYPRYRRHRRWRTGDYRSRSPLFDPTLMLAVAGVVQLGGHPRIVVAMPGAHRVGLTGLVQLFHRVVPRCLQHPEASPVVGILRQHKRFVH